MASMECCQLQYYDKYVSRTMRCLPDKFTELCHRHLAILLDLSGDKLELLLSGHEEHKKKKSGLPSVGMFKKKDKPQGLFGLPLTDEGACLMMPLIQFLKMEDNVTNEGLFRIPGNKSKMTTLRELLIAHGPAVNIDPEIFSAYDVASVLKEFIRELPEPLLTERHLEAHMQILALGQQAKTTEEIANCAARKLSAVQLLMLLLPPPAQILTMHLVKLLKKTADSPESRMTPATLGTIFAPIFMIDRKVQPIDLLSQISKTSPAVSFIIDKANELFQAPKELVMDVTKFWKSLKQSFLSGNRESGQMQKSLSGQTLYTDGCVADSNLSVCDDGTSNITAELANLLEQMHKHKDKAKKSFDAPEFCASLRRRSRSIGSTIRKRLPSLKNTRNGQEDVQRSRASSLSAHRSDSKTETSTDSCQIECSTETSKERCFLQLPKPGQKRRHSSENCRTAISSSSSNSPMKQKCQEAATYKVTQAGKQKHLKNAGSEARLPPNGCSINVVSDFVEKKNTRARRLTSDLEDPAPYDTKNKDHIRGPAACDIKNKLSTQQIVHLYGEFDPVSSHLRKEKSHLTHAVLADSSTTRKFAAKSVTDRKSRPVTNTSHQRSRKPLTATSAESCQIACSTETSEARCSLKLQKPGQRHHPGSKNCPTTTSTSNGNPPVKQKYQKTATCKITPTDNQKHPNKADCGAQLPPNGRSTNVGLDFAQKRHSRGLTSDLEDRVTCDIENKENIKLSPTIVIGNQRSSHLISQLNGITDSVNSNILQQKLSPAHTDSKVSMAKYKASSVHFEDKENLTDPIACDIKNKVSTHHMSLFFGDMDPVSSYVLQHMLRPAHAVSVNPLVTKKSATDRKSRPVTNTHLQQPRKPLTTVMPNGTIRVRQETSV